LTPSIAASTSGSTGGTLSVPNAQYVSDGAGIQQIFEFVLVAVNHNIIRVAGGALGFPVL
jgi:hypothetical protein